MLATINFTIKPHFIQQIIVCLVCFISLNSTAQPTIKNDTVLKISTVDTAKLKTFKKHNPKESTRRSLILPGWGQAYNKEYWKIPIVYGVLSIPTITFFYNNTIYKETRFAYEARFKAAQRNATNADSVDYFTLEPKYQTARIDAIQSVRNASRRDRDFSILWFLLAWGLNVADATVFGHLKDFDVSKDLSIQIKPDFNLATRTPGINLTLKLKSTPKKTLLVK